MLSGTRESSFLNLSLKPIKKDLGKTIWEREEFTRELWKWHILVIKQAEGLGKEMGKFQPYQTGRPDRKHNHTNQFYFILFYSIATLTESCKPESIIFLPSLQSPETRAIPPKPLAQSTIQLWAMLSLTR